MKYKVGDEVRIITNDDDGFGYGYQGYITGIPNGFSTYYYVIDDEYRYTEDEIELVKVNPTTLQVKLKLLTDTAVIPRYSTAGAACFDICADEDVIVHPGCTVAVSTGLAFEIPFGYQVKILPRSGISLRTPLRVVLGTIDEDFRGEVKVLLWNSAIARDFHAFHKYIDNTESPRIRGCVPENTYAIRRGDRVAQCEIVPVIQASFVTVDELSVTERGERGLGSTGVS